MIASTLPELIRRRELSAWHYKHVLSRNMRIEEDLVDQLFNSSEKRLAWALLLLARYGKQGRPQEVLPKVSQEMLAEMIGTTGSRVNIVHEQIPKTGIHRVRHRLRGLQINSSLVGVVGGTATERTSGFDPVVNHTSF